MFLDKIIHRPTLKQEIAKHVGQVYASLSSLLNEALPLANLDLLVMSDYNGNIKDYRIILYNFFVIFQIEKSIIFTHVYAFSGTHSFGLMTLSYEEWEGSDEAHRIALLAKNFARQWMVPFFGEF